MDDTMVSNEVDNENRLGSLVFLKSHAIDLKDINPSSISVFMFISCGLGFFVPLHGYFGFWLGPSSILIILLQFNKGVYIN
jgi:hypothetical protein